MKKWDKLFEFLTSLLTIIAGLVGWKLEGLTGVAVAFCIVIFAILVVRFGLREKCRCCKGEAKFPERYVSAFQTHAGFIACQACNARGWRWLWEKGNS